MAIKTTWSVNNMTRVNADGGVITAYWSLIAQSDGEGQETAQEGVKNEVTYDASSSGFIAYADLKESDVFLSWLDEQPASISDGIYKNNTDVKWAARVIDLFKADNDIKTPKPRNKSKSTKDHNLKHHEMTQRKL